eukprot:CAMPEP_0115000632 /NCGR_PEP_ID=MMETSP0216-20121206/16876_1 /TAXON_ID=223996 /ORGANISM="Protocruzia adherens, Strain Boccale" /LENGTH=306 /DNA_ID=CAMNT_0002365773 /DNA_START=49 /DNA_END=969 /DNA_ORIENTATION=-
MGKTSGKRHMDSSGNIHTSKKSSSHSSRQGEDQDDSSGFGGANAHTNSSMASGPFSNGFTIGAPTMMQGPGGNSHQFFGPNVMMPYVGPMGIGPTMTGAENYQSGPQEEKKANNKGVAGKFVEVTPEESSELVTSSAPSSSIGAAKPGSDKTAIHARSNKEHFRPKEYTRMGDKKKYIKTCVRKIGGEVWEDPSMSEWPENDFRIFCGDLGNEVTDEVLANAFRKYGSFQKAKVIRDKKITKSKGYGFVSFADADDYIRAMKEMNGKYVGNRPVKLRASDWQARSVVNGKNKAASSKIKRYKPSTS